MNRYDNRSYDDNDNRYLSSEMPSKKFECPECSTSFSSRYSWDRHVCNFQESEESAMDSDEDEETSDVTDGEQEEMEQDSDTAPFDDFIDLIHEPHSGEKQ